MKTSAGSKLLWMVGGGLLFSLSSVLFLWFALSPSDDTEKAAAKPVTEATASPDLKTFVSSPAEASREKPSAHPFLDRVAEVTNPCVIAQREAAQQRGRVLFEKSWAEGVAAVEAETGANLDRLRHPFSPMEELERRARMSWREAWEDDIESGKTDALIGRVFMAMAEKMIQERPKDEASLQKAREKFKGFKEQAKVSEQRSLELDAELERLYREPFIGLTDAQKEDHGVHDE